MDQKNDGRTTGYDEIFRALGDPHRMQIIDLLAQREMNAGELLEPLDIVQSTLSHHMKVLTDSGVVNAVRKGKWTLYSLNERSLQDACRVLGLYAEKAASLPRSQPEEESGKKAPGQESGVKAGAAAGSALPERRAPEQEEDTVLQHEEDAREDLWADWMQQPSSAGNRAADESGRKKGKKSKKNKKNGRK